MPDKRKAVGQPSPPKRRGRPRRGHDGDSSSQSPVGRTQRRDQVGDSSQPTPVRRRLRRGQDGDSSQPPPVRGRQGQDGDSSQPPPVRGRPKRRQVEASSQQFSPQTWHTLFRSRFMRLFPSSQLSSSDSVRFTPCVTATLSGEHASRVVSSTPPHLTSGIPSIDEKSVIDSITARVIQVMHSDMQTSTPLTDSAEMVSSVIQSLFSGETGELPSDIPKPYTSVSHPLGASLPHAVKKIWADEYINLATLLDNNRHDDISVTLKKSAGQPIISLFNSSKKEIVSIDEWTRAFLIFSAVYVEKKPIEAGSLCKYISLIRDMAFV